MADYTQSTKSCIQHPVLYISNLPSYVEHGDLVQAIKGFKDEVIRIALSDKVRDVNSNWRQSRHEPLAQMAEIEFRTVAQGRPENTEPVHFVRSLQASEAERILATQNFRSIQSQPPVVLSRSAKRGIDSILSQVSGNPRLVRLLPSIFTTDVQLYDLLRPFGPLASVRVSKELGGTVQFWTEEDAQHAEAAVRVAFSRESRMTLQEYDPCSLFCRVWQPFFVFPNHR